LSEIYNINDDNRFYDDEEKDNRIVGFGKWVLFTVQAIKKGF
jgi:hypothetical protein